MSSTSSLLRIGIFGGGTVGGGVYELLQSSKTLSQKVSVEKICVRSVSKPRDFAAPSSLFTTNPQDILDNDAIDCVVEVMGGTGLAKTVVLQALEKGKAVVTANKVLMAEHLHELHQAALTAKKPLLYEAAVCGGIPIISLLQTAYAGDVITNVQGIANGTTNFMLTKMDEQGANYADVLQEAQALGYAEADPTADVEGHDVRAKLALMAKLAYGTTIDPPERMACVGITHITATDFAYARAQQCTIKLLGTATLVSDDAEDAPNSTPQVSIAVVPTLVPKSHFLASVRGSGNAICLTSQNMGPCLYTGPGAGRYPTANSVVADIGRVAEHVAPLNPFPHPESQWDITTDFTSPFYIRVTLATPTQEESVTSQFNERGMSVTKLESLTTTTTAGDGTTTTTTLAWITNDPCSFQTIQAMVQEWNSQSSTVSSALAMPVLSAAP